MQLAHKAPEDDMDEVEADGCSHNISHGALTTSPNIAYEADMTGTHYWQSFRFSICCNSSLYSVCMYGFKFNAFLLNKFDSNHLGFVGCFNCNFLLDRFVYPSDLTL